ncbi:MAG: isochorismatase family protein [Pirellulales bacterium]
MHISRRLRGSSLSDNWSIVVWLAAVLLCSLAALPSPAAEGDAVPARVKVPGTLRLLARQRREPQQGIGQLEIVETPVEWKASETAIIICDMWDKHWCQAATQRVGAMVPRMNEVLTAARGHGVQIIHCPSDTLKFYEGTPFRRRMTQAVTATPPSPIDRWCRLERDKEGDLPIDDKEGGCEDPDNPPSQGVWTRQHPALDILGYDGVTDSGVEVYNYCQQEGIKNLVLMGVHTNMCVLGRSFGIRQMTKVGMNVVLARDLTDAMYDPRKHPFVSHTRGTELVVEHIERHWCPSIASADLLQVVPGSDDPAGATK